MIKICTIVQEYYPKDIRVKKQCETLSKNGFLVTVICLKNKNEKKFEVIDGVKIYRLNLQKKRGTKFRYIFEYLMFFILTFFKLNKLDLKEKYKIIQVNTLPDFLVFSTIVQKIRGAKIVLDMHEIMPEFFMSKYGKKESDISIKLLKWIEKLSLNFANEVITINEPIKNIFKERAIPRKNITVIMNTIDETVIPPIIKRNNGKNFNLVYHGTISEIYGLDIAIKALENINIKNLRFYIFGEGPLRAYLEKLSKNLGLQDIIYFKGQVSYVTMMEYLSFMSIGILPLKKDVFLDLSFSNKLAEYVYLKIPVIISNLKTVKYYFNECEITYFNSQNVNDLRNKIIYAYNNINIMNEKAEKAYLKYQSIKWSVMSNRYLSLIKKIIK